MMMAFQEVIRDYECPDQAVLWKDLPIYLSPMIAWLETCRPKGVAGGNSIRWLKSEINKLGEGDERTETEVSGHESHCDKSCSLGVESFLTIAKSVVDRKHRPLCPG